MKRKRYSSNASHAATKQTTKKRTHLEPMENEGGDEDGLVRVSTEDMEPELIIPATAAAETPPAADHGHKSATTPSKGGPDSSVTAAAKTTPEPETLLYGRFRFIKTLGRGVFSETKLYEDCNKKGSSPKLVAIKKMKAEYKNIGLNEYDVLDRLYKSPTEPYSDRHIVRKIGAFYGPEADGTLHLMLEPLLPSRVRLPKCPHSTDSTRIIGHPCQVRERAFQKIVLQVLLGIQFLHRNGIIHADLHPGNILRSEETGHIKLVDFGNSIPDEALGDYESHFEVCAEGYRSPELLFEKGPVAQALDVWALGIICVEWILSDEDPFMSHGGLVKVDGEMLGSLKDLFGCGRKSGWNYCRGGRLWDDDAEATYIRGLQDDVGSLKPYLLTLTRSSGLVRFIMSMLELNPMKRKTSHVLLKDEYLIQGLLGAWSEILLPKTPTASAVKSDLRSHADDDRWEDEETFIDENELEARIHASQRASISRQTASSNSSAAGSAAANVTNAPVAFPSLLIVGSSASSSSQRAKLDSRLPPTPVSENNALPAAHAQKPLPRTPRKVMESTSKTNSPRSSRPGTRTPVHSARPGLAAQVIVLQDSTPLKNVDFALRSNTSLSDEDIAVVERDRNFVLPNDEDEDDDEVALV